MKMLVLIFLNLSESAFEELGWKACLPTLPANNESKAHHPYREISWESLKSSLKLAIQSLLGLPVLCDKALKTETEPGCHH